MREGHPADYKGPRSVDTRSEEYNAKAMSVAMVMLSVLVALPISAVRWSADEGPFEWWPIAWCLGFAAFFRFTAWLVKE